MGSDRLAHFSVAERFAQGADARTHTPPELHSRWETTADRPDPIARLVEQGATRDRDLVAARYARMMISPFTFYCGAARIMAGDLAATPTAGLMAQLCGDANLSNFGVFAAPAGRQVFDFCDFDETLPGPFEYDIKRLATSVTVAARHNGLCDDECRRVTSSTVHAYRTAMARFARMGVLEVWYSRIPDIEITTALHDLGGDDTGRRGEAGGGRTASSDPGVYGPADAQLAADAPPQARANDRRQIDAGLVELVGPHDRITGRPPITGSSAGRPPHQEASNRDIKWAVHEQIREFRATLRGERRHLADRFQVLDVARGGTRADSNSSGAFIVLMQGRDKRDLLRLQLKEATASVLEDHLPGSRYRNAGERVVRGQRMMQATADIFLGWTKGVRTNRSYYVRQLWEVKDLAAVDTMPATQLDHYAGLCARTLAHAHARSGDPIAIDAYLAEHDDFDRAIAEFSRRYADQNDQDYQAFIDAARSGRTPSNESPIPVGPCC